MNVKSSITESSMLSELDELRFLKNRETITNGRTCAREKWRLKKIFMISLRVEENGGTIQSSASMRKKTREAKQCVDKSENN